MDFDDLFVPASTWSPVDIGLVIDSVEAHAGGNVTFRVSQVRGYNISTGQPVTSLYSVTSRELSFIESGEVVARTGDFVQGGEISVGDQNVELMQINFFAENDEVQVTDLGFGVEGEGDAAALDIGLFNSSGQLLQMAIPHNGYLTYDLASFDRIRVPEGGSDFVTMEALKMFDGFTDGDIRLRLNTLEAVTAATGNDLQPGFITVDDVVSETFTLSDPTP